MIVEQRTYTFHPGKLPAWLEAYATEGNPASSRHTGPSMGFFLVEIGPVLNQAVFFRGYDDIDARTRGNAAREQDPQWAEFRKKSAGLGALRQQESKFLAPTSFSPYQQAAGFKFERTLPGTDMIVDHRTYDFHPATGNRWIKAYEEHGLPIQKKYLGQLLGFYTTEVGPINQAVFMWAYESMGDRQRRRAEMDKDPAWADFLRLARDTGALKQQTNKLIKPMPFSPIR